MQAREIQAVLKKDGRGNLAFIDPLPFPPQRWFSIEKVPFNQSRGHHAHRTCQQLILCAGGWFDLEVSTPAAARVWEMDSGKAVLVPPLHWVVLRNFTDWGYAVVLASEPYCVEEMITDSEEFRKLAQ